MITYTWEILSLTKQYYAPLDLENVVVSVEWKKIGTNEDGRSVEYVCHTDVPPPTTAEGFTDLDDLTEEQVIEWVVSRIDPGAMSAIDAFIESQFHTHAATQTIPWEKKSKKTKKKAK
jgi:hypothetical protein